MAKNLDIGDWVEVKDWQKVGVDHKGLNLGVVGYLPVAEAGDAVLVKFYRKEYWVTMKNLRRVTREQALEKICQVITIE